MCFLCAKKKFVFSFSLIGLLIFSSGELLAFQSKADNKVYKKVDQQPEFPGGTDSLMLFIDKNIEKPSISVSKGKLVNVSFSFIVEKDGTLSKIKLKPGSFEPLTKELLAVLEGSRWLPGKIENNVKRVKTQLDVLFYLEKLEDGQYAKIQVAQKPTFPGGEDALQKFLSDNIVYPVYAREQNIHGRVIIEFEVEEDGSLSNVTLIQSVGGGCDLEAIRVVNLMPKWIPGKLGGEPMKLKFRLPVKFELESRDRGPGVLKKR